MELRTKLFTIEEAARLLNMSAARIRYEIFHKRIPLIRIGKSIRFDENDLIAWIKKQKQEVANGK